MGMDGMGGLHVVGGSEDSRTLVLKMCAVDFIIV